MKGFAAVLFMRFCGTTVMIASGLPPIPRRQVRQYLSAVLPSFCGSLRGLAQHIAELARKETKIHLFALSAILLLAILLRLSFLSQPMRYDESFTFLNYASRPLHVGLSLYDKPNNHLFHTLLVHIACLLLGDEPRVIRLPALLAGILLVPASYIASRILFNRCAALLTAGLVASSSALVEYSTNARGYTLICLIFLAILALGTHLKRSKNPAAWLMFAVLSALGFYTIPTMFYPFGIVVTWLLLSAISGDASLPPRPLVRNLLLHIAVTAGLTFVLYVPPIVVSGLASVTSNRFVASQPWSYFATQFPASLYGVWNQWHRDIPVAVTFLLMVGFLTSLVLGQRLTTRRVSIVLAVAIWCIPVLLVQRVVPYPRVWLFLLPLYMALASWGLSHVFRPIERITKHHHAIWAILCVVLSFSLGLEVVRRQSVYLSNETGTLRDAETIAVLLKHRLRPGDRVLATRPSDYPLMYYFGRHDISVNYLLTDMETTRRILVVVNEPRQTLEGLLQEANISRSDWSFPKLVERFQFSSLFELERMDAR